MKRVLIVIGGPVVNMGSQALVRGLVKNVKSVCPDSHVTVAATDEGFDRRLGLPDVDRYMQRYSIVSGRMNWVRIVNGVGRRLLGERFDTARYRIYHLLEAAKGSDLVLIIGGDNFDRSYHSLDYMWELDRFLEEIGPQKTVLCNCSVSKEDLSERALADIRRFRYITARDSLSYENLKAALPGNDIRFFPDAAFCLDKEAVALPEGWEPGNMIGINVSSLIGDGRYGVSEEMVLRSMKEMIDAVLRQTSLKICFIPHVKKDADLSVLRKLDRYVGDRERALLIDREDLSAVQKKYIISNCRLFVGARTHATIAAYSSMVPTLVIGYSVKSVGIATDLFGTADGFVVPISEFRDPGRLAAAFRRFLERETEIRAQLEARIPSYIEAAEGVRTLIREVLGDDR
ncbi:polysaccharide pyruvyl transferase family protein [uncultured Oscillibacter sp.]|uniref:polysaccharide pyruvyl transferase family protein n=1 Tax=uncultured Oscillibacter sp. TaxID=876091 RepID=UPI0025F2989A|nr:polysaccharide pyruvyl transferase family protein [uncultured Oscillibacter sp.]